MVRRILNLKLLAGVVVVALIATGGWFWYRSSSLVQVRHVTVTGLSGPNVKQIRGTLTSAALTMTTLNLSMDKLESSVEAYPQVSSLDVTTHGSHSVTIDVFEKIPLAAVGGSYVDSAGRILSPSSTVREKLPKLLQGKQASAYADVDGQVTGKRSLAELKVLGAAPYTFLAYVRSAKYTSADGVVLRLKNGPQLYFGNAERLKQKWKAALAVLRTSDSAGAGHIDISDPQRPAAGV